MPSRSARFDMDRAYNDSRYTGYSERPEYYGAKAHSDRRFAGASRRAEFNRARDYDDEYRYSDYDEKAESYRARPRGDDRYADSERAEFYRARPRRDDRYADSERAACNRAKPRSDDRYAGYSRRAEFDTFEDPIAPTGPRRRVHFSKARDDDVNVSRPKCRDRSERHKGASDTCKQDQGPKSDPPKNTGPFIKGYFAPDGTFRKSSAGNPVPSHIPDLPVWLCPWTGQYVTFGRTVTVVSDDPSDYDMEEAMDWEWSDPNKMEIEPTM